MKIEKDFGRFLFRYLLFHIASIGSFCKLVLVKIFYHFGYRKPFIQPYLLDVFYFIVSIYLMALKILLCFHPLNIKPYINIII